MTACTRLLIYASDGRRGDDVRAGKIGVQIVAPDRLRTGGDNVAAVTIVTEKIVTPVTDNGAEAAL